jgi:hypothetical protein
LGEKTGHKNQRQKLQPVLYLVVEKMKQAECKTDHGAKCKQCQQQLLQFNNFHNFDLFTNADFQNQG